MTGYEVAFTETLLGNNVQVHWLVRQTEDAHNFWGMQLRQILH